jgi:hypothetical protein
VEVQKQALKDAFSGLLTAQNKGLQYALHEAAEVQNFS